MKNILKLNQKSKKNSKAVVGNAKKKRNKLKVTYFALIAVLVLSTATYSGFAAWKTRQYKAYAESWQFVYADPSIKFWACKEYVSTIYGTVWRVHILAQRLNTSVGVIQAGVYRNGYMPESAWSDVWFYGLASVKVNASGLVPDQIWLYYLKNKGSNGPFNIGRASYLRNC